MTQKKPLPKDVELMEKMFGKLTDIWNDLEQWCNQNCPYECGCKQFAGGCAIQTMKSVSNWGQRVIFKETQIQKKASS